MKNNYRVNFFPVSFDREVVGLPFVATSYQVNKLAYVLSLVFKYSQYSMICINKEYPDGRLETVVTLDFPNAKESV